MIVGLKQFNIVRTKECDYFNSYWSTCYLL